MLTEQHIAKLWIKMVRIYGHRWRSSYGDADDGTWLTGLKNLTVEQLTTGIVACIENGDAWPPSLPEFRSKCLQLPSIENLVYGALSFSHDPYADRLRSMVTSHDRQTLNRHQLITLYRAHATKLMQQIQAERTGVPIAAKPERSGFNKVLNHLR